MRRCRIVLKPKWTRGSWEHHSHHNCNYFSVRMRLILWAPAVWQWKDCTKFLEFRILSFCYAQFMLLPIFIEPVFRASNWTVFRSAWISDVKWRRMNFISILGRRKINRSTHRLSQLKKNLHFRTFGGFSLKFTLYSFLKNHRQHPFLNEFRKIPLLYRCSTFWSTVSP